MTMKRILFIVAAMAMLLAFAAPAGAGGNGATQLSGLGAPGDFTVCDDPEGAGSDFPIVIIGDLVGCLYQTFGPGGFSPSGTYFERGTEVFVGCLADGETCGTFSTTYVFTGKYTDQFFTEEIFGRCQHPIVKGSGTGDFEGISGRLDFKDDVEAGNFPMRGHIKLNS